MNKHNQTVNKSADVDAQPLGTSVIESACRAPGIRAYLQRPP
jgi:hypothetical protein